MERMLVLGASGLVGKAVFNRLSNNYDVYGTYNKNKKASERYFFFNMEKINNITDILDRIMPSKIVYCLTGDFKLQTELLATLLKYLESVNGKLYFCSTANVFDRDSTRPHFRNDQLTAESDYGKFKIQCENMLKDGLGENSIILRLPMMWGKNSPRFNKLIKTLQNNENAHVYSNLYFNSNTDIMLARQIEYIISNDLKGIFHPGASDAINYYEFIKNIIASLGYKIVHFDEERLPLEKYYLAALPEDGELPEELRICNKDVIDYLTE